MIGKTKPGLKMLFVAVLPMRNRSGNARKRQDWKSTSGKPFEWTLTRYNWMFWQKSRVAHGKSGSYEKICGKYFGHLIHGSSIQNSKIIYLYVFFFWILSRRPPWKTDISTKFWQNSRIFIRTPSARFQHCRHNGTKVYKGVSHRETGPSLALGP